MRIRLDPWPVDTQNAQLTLKPFAGRVYDVESPRWEAVAACPLPESLRQVLVVDGRPRMDARLLLEDDAGRLSVAGFGAYAVGAVDLCPHGHRQARFHGVDMQRVMAFGGDLQLSAERLSPRNPQTGELIYQPQSFSGTDILGAQAAIQKRMLDTERALAQALASALPLEEDDPDEAPETLVLQDGPVRVGEAGRAVVGYIKSLHTDYLGEDRNPLLMNLKCGERTPILRFTLGDRGEGNEASGREQRFTWYVRLADARFYEHPLAGVMRLEMHAPEDADFVPRAVRDIADLSGTLLRCLGSQPHKDGRAPQNLVPTAALEQEMSRRLGNAELVTRRIRAHLAQQRMTA
ncbi:DNA double-strand break repair nuclease NurA [Deinococcus radiophilus]|uniref:Nuclease n=1 Tax=Deinococcus radiophilus TaxID=32062 RepID=A0A3S0KHT6_9DEIO|nr:DNA double-strand break repair nuclease NurA [Deinococcus radiophilus]RTR30822.1 nuclease [Deinococcus radiophilus]UFA49404.1 DNA double-strand break repair nuclease NurA [Deinococcus radiophilus]